MRNSAKTCLASRVAFSRNLDERQKTNACGRRCTLRPRGAIIMLA